MPPGWRRPPWLWLLISGWGGAEPPSPTENPTGVASRDTISALGRLEPKGGVTDVGGTTGERVDQLKVAEGDRVEAGQELALLGSYALRKSEHQLAEIQVQEGEARLAADASYGDAVVAEAEAAVDQLRLVALDEAALKQQSLLFGIEIEDRRP